MTVEQLLQFYAPFAGLLGVVFWLGVLSNRVKNLEDDIKPPAHLVEDHDRLVTLETEVRAMRAEQEKQGRGIEGIQRTLANFVTRPNSITEIRTSP
jgi:hypothetical protein